MTYNPRTHDSKKRLRSVKRLRSMGLPCWLCKRAIDYSLTTYIDRKDGKRKRHPLSFEADDYIPVSRYQLGGYATAEECACDFGNLRPSHRKCNQKRGNLMPWEAGWPFAKADGEPSNESECAPVEWSADW